MPITQIRQPPSKLDQLAQVLAMGLGGYTQGRELKRSRGQQKIRDLIEMSKLDPSVFRSPEFESARKKAGFPAMRPQRQPTLEDVLAQVGTKDYGKPSISVGPQGKMRGATFTPKKAVYPEGYTADLKNAISALNRGADRIKVYQRIAAQYPKQSAELKRILLYTPAESRLEAFRQALGFGSE